MADEWVQKVACLDVAHRPRDVRVVVEGTSIVLVSPPGEVVRLTSGDSQLLRSALEDAEIETRGKRRS